VSVTYAAKRAARPSVLDTGAACTASMAQKAKIREAVEDFMLIMDIAQQ
jgi:hypothetical protein